MTEKKRKKVEDQQFLENLGNREVMPYNFKNYFDKFS